MDQPTYKENECHLRMEQGKSGGWAGRHQSAIKVELETWNTASLTCEYPVTCLLVGWV